MRVKRLRGVLALSVLTVLVASMATKPSQAHVTPVTTLPRASQVVRGVDATQTKPNTHWMEELPDEVNAELNGPETVTCADQSAVGIFMENPCWVEVTFNQPITPFFSEAPGVDFDISSEDPADWTIEVQPGTPTAEWVNKGSGLIEVDGPNGLESGRITFRDASNRSTATNPPGQLTSIPGPDTIRFTPGTFVPNTETEDPDDTLFVPGSIGDGDYTVTTKVKGIDGHGVDCDPNNKANCFSFSFTIAATPETPVVTNAGAVDHRNFEVQGTAESLSTIEIYQENGAEDLLIGSGATDVEGNFRAPSALPAGESTIYAVATSKPTRWSEVNLHDCGDGDPEDIDGDDNVVPPPTATSAAVGVDADVVGDSAPTLSIHTHPDEIQSEGPAVIEGEAEDNDEVTAVNVTVTDAAGNAIAEGAGTWQLDAPTGVAISLWSIHFSAPGHYVATVTASDATTTTDAITQSITITVGDLLQSEPSPNECAE